MSANGVKSALVRRVVVPLAAQLRQGVTPEKLALAMALGLIIGSIPFFGIATWICALLGVALGLNQVAIQIANYAAYPVQIALFVPFLRAGARLFGSAPIELSLAQLRAELASSFWQTVGHYSLAEWHAIVAWAVVLPVAGTGAYIVLLWLLRALRTRIART